MILNEKSYMILNVGIHLITIVDIQAQVWQVGGFWLFLMNFMSASGFWPSCLESLGEGIH